MILYDCIAKMNPKVINSKWFLYDFKIISRRFQNDFYMIQNVLESFQLFWKWFKIIWKWLQVFWNFSNFFGSDSNPIPKYLEFFQLCWKWFQFFWKWFQIFWNFSNFFGIDSNPIPKYLKFFQLFWKWFKFFWNWFQMFWNFSNSFGNDSNPIPKYLEFFQRFWKWFKYNSKKVGNDSNFLRLDKVMKWCNWVCFQIFLIPKWCSELIIYDSKIIGMIWMFQNVWKSQRSVWWWLTELILWPRDKMISWSKIESKSVQKWPR